MDNIVAIYNRLSEEDKDKLSKEEESRSIQNQKSMLVSYAVSQGWEIYNIYSDDDYKGSDRSRPAFNQLLKDAEAGKFNIVLCKSQARFTRELEMVEKIIHGQFIEWGIRFVGYADNADTDNKGNKKSRQINGLVNEWYLEDLSDNIKTVLTDHRKKGMHIGAFALYGYKKDPDQKGHLIIDPEAAAVVREVFEMYAEGMGRTAIARALNDKNIPNPTEYKRLQGLKYKGANKKYGNLWKYFAITDMLSNEMYIGTMVQGKYEHRTYKSQSSKPVPKERWIRVEGTHEPIIDKELWDKVQQRMKERAKPMCNGETGIFAGKTKCMYCGYTLSSQKNRNFYYLRCPSRHYSDSSCKGAHISRNLLEKAVLFELNSIIDRYFDASSAEKKIILNRDISLKKNALRNEIKTYHQKVDDLKKAIRSAYIDKAKGVITESEYFEFRDNFQNDIILCQEHIANLEEKLNILEQKTQESRTRTDILREYQNVQKLDRLMVEKLIDYIEVGRLDHKEHRDDLPPIVIHWKF
ncbi:MAG: recombinase family protein [Lachnospiraceae bacterium]|jgi:DNA invertase Pin-like site-specific DNA recombinase|nr:recombinase family protein [Lachnospiraceae bacterium]